MENRNLSIVGAGGKGSTSGRTPVESPDSLRSISYAKTIILLGEGEMRGLVNGYRSVYLQGAPLQNSDGTFNFQNVSIDTRSGTQDQSYIPGFPSVENEVIVGVELRAENPVVRSVSGSDLSAVRVRLSVDALQKVDTSNGDTVGYSVSYAIDVATDGGAYTTVLNSAFTGKTTTRYERSHRIDLPAGSQWQIRVRRLTPNATSATIADITRVQSITEIIDAKLRYPNSALLAVSVDAQQFQSLPTIACNVYGRIIKVPANYDPELRTYATTGPGTTNGVWNGTFKSAWTNNPAWVFYDIVTNDRFGLGNNIPAAWVDAWNLYQIAQYCDEMVSDGFGGQEPRFTCNVYMQTRADAYKVLQDLAAVFRGVSYYAVGQMIASADMPKQVSVGYTNADVVDGRFEYESSARKVRHTVALVSWSDQTDMGRQKVERVEFRPGLIRYGIQETEVTAIGCTSRGQAQRIGNHILVSENLERETIAFKVGLSGVLVSPGDVFNVSNRNRAGRRMHGRIGAFTADTVIVDQVPDEIGAGDTIKVMLSTGRLEARTIQSITGNSVKVTVDWSANPAKQGIFIFEMAELVAETFRCIGVSDNEDGTYTISGLSYRADKFAYIDDGTRLEQPPISVIPPSVQAPPANVTLTSFSVIDQAIARTDVTIQWDSSPNAIEYEVEWRRDDMDWVRVGRVSSTSVDIRGAYSGQYLARVRAVNALGARSIPATSMLTQIVGKTEPPPALTSLTTTSLVYAIGLQWGFPQGATDTERTEIWYSQGPDRASAIKLGDYAYPQNKHQINNILAGTKFYFWGRLVDRSGNIGPWYPTGTGVVGESSVDQTEYDAYFSGRITESALGQDLLSKIDSIDNIVPLIYDPDAVYEEGQTVIYGGRIYSWTNSTPGNNQPPSADWQDVGEAIAQAGAIVGRVDQLELDVSEIDGELTAQGQRVDGLFASIDTQFTGDTDDYTADNDVFAGTTTIQTVVATQDYALSRRIETVQSTVGEVSATVQETSQALVDLDGQINASWTLKLQIAANGQYYAAGMGVGIENQPDGSFQSQILMQADRFAVINVANGQVTSPFVIQGGQTFISQALIGTSWITNAMIANAAITNAKISGTIQSDDYVSGQTGWRINKAAGGGFEFNGSIAGGYRLNITNQGVYIYYPNGNPAVELGVLL
ncbi:putative tail tip fiber protein [Siphoviridae environmental samples]|nr:putative tail tip fiber protein [Siphoviridae environmental samples]